ncbi:hypothetical protein EK21DRAFT_55297 [Setomelanomma holmii]|uniref:Uncharacterized protein n=1 Tax=Setomelanomma holmii TaxID=210430 RepID=A0A9P4HJ50_9PLEO|nr:hypothetical protein EK21DRAFT_55297 [Setomelanomma holmii]
MATVAESGSPSRLPSHKFTPYNNAAQTNMFDYPTELASAQLEAKAILSHLFTRLKDKDSKYHARYGKWIAKHARLEEFCFRCIRPQAWAFLNGRWSLDALKLVGGDIFKFEGKGVYLNGVLGLDKKVRVYIGQANSIRQRVSQHLNFRFRRDNPSLHYHAMQQSVYNAIGLVAVLPSPNMGNHALPGMDSPDLLLNILEMWTCLIFRTLPTQTLEEWLPSDGTINTSRRMGLEGEFGGLNIASPLDHGEKQREWLDLSDSPDPLIRDYLGLGRQISEEQRECKEEEDSPAQRRREYGARTRSYNARKRQAEQEIPVTPGAAGGILVLLVVAVVAGTMWGRRSR